MAKICEHCKQPYDDDLQHCPHCAPAVELVDEDEAETFLLRPEPEGHEAPPGEEEAAIDFAGLDKSASDSNPSGVVLGLEPEDVLPASGPAPAKSDSAVDLVHPADDLEADAAHPAEAGPSGGAAQDSWAALVEEHEAAPAEEPVVTPDPTSDVSLARDTPAEEAHAEAWVLDEPAEGERSAVQLGGAGRPAEGSSASDVRPADEPA